MKLIGRLFPWLILVGLVYAVFSMQGWTPKARPFPMAVAVFGLVLVVLELATPFVAFLRKAVGPQGRIMDLGMGNLLDDLKGQKAELRALAWLLALIFGVILFGFHLTILVYMLLYLRIEGKVRWVTSLIVTACVMFVVFGVMGRIVNMPWPEPMLWTWLVAGSGR